MQKIFAAAMRVALLAGFVAFTAAPAPASAVQFTLDVLQNGTSRGSLDATQLGCDAGTKTAHCAASNITVGDLLIQNLDLNLDSDPVINGVVAVVNNAAVTQQFTLIFTLGVVPIPGSSLTGGSVSGGVSDFNGNGATLSTVAGSAIYSALLDNIVYDTLFPHSTVVTVIPPFESENLPSGTGVNDFGTPIPSQPGPGVASSIGIKYDFNLTAQDGASFTGVFVVVPEPTTALLVGVGLAMLARVGRRR